MSVFGKQNMCFGIVLCVSLVTGAGVSPAQAHDDHNHEAAVEPAPRGGILRDAPPYKSELVLNQDEAKIYAYDKSLKPLDAAKLAPTAKGELAFPKDKKKKVVTFTLKDGAYQAKLAGIDKVHRYDLHVTLTVDGKPVLVDFGVDNIH